MTDILTLVALLSCGFQNITATHCVDVSGKVVPVGPADQKYALTRKLICARPASDNDLEDPALLIFWDEGETREDAQFRLTYERVNGCDPQ